MPYYLRQMRKEDIEQVTEIDREAFPTQWPAANFNSEMRNQMAHFTVACDAEKSVSETGATASPRNNHSGLIARLKQFFSGNHPSPNNLSSSDGHYIVGFIGSWIMADEAHITTIAVREAYRRQGIGELLLISAIELAMELKADIVTLEVRVSNTGAQKLYSKYGFTQVGLRKGYYTDNREDAIIMSTDKITSAPFQARFQQLKQALSNRTTIVAKAAPLK